MAGDGGIDICRNPVVVTRKQRGSGDRSSTGDLLRQEQPRADIVQGLQSRRAGRISGTGRIVSPVSARDICRQHLLMVWVRVPGRNERGDSVPAGLSGVDRSFRHGRTGPGPGLRVTVKSPQPEFQPGNDPGKNTDGTGAWRRERGRAGQGRSRRVFPRRYCTLHRGAVP